MGPGNLRGQSMAVNKKTRKRISKKGVFLTFIAITIAGVIIFSLLIYTGYRQRDKMFVIETRIDTIEDFMSGLEKDLSRGLFISSFRSVLAIEQYVITTGVFFDSTETRFKEALLNSTVNGTYIDLIANSSFTDWITKIQSQADKIGIIVDIDVTEITINQSDSWNIIIGMNLSINVSDRKNTAAWLKAQNIETKLSVEGFEDPLYALNSYGRITNAIVNNNNASFSSISTLVNHINSSNYIASTTAPSFLMRLEGNLSASEQGIESLVNTQEFVNQGIPGTGRSNVDYIYFGTGSSPACIVNQTLPYFTWFRLDNDHLSVYRVSCA